MTKNATALLSVLSLAVLLSAACGTTPERGDDGGRIEVSDTTAADRYSTSVSSVTLLEFADQVAERLAKRVPSIQEIEAKPYRVLIELGDIQNSTNTSPRDFETIRRRIFLSMVNNPQITNTAQINQHPSRTARQAGAFKGEEPKDLMDEGIETRSTAGEYRLEDTYTINGTFGEIKRAGISTYIFDVTMVNLSTREIVFAEVFEARQAR